MVTRCAPSRRGPRAGRSSGIVAFVGRPARRCCPASGSGTPPSCRRSRRCWAPPTRPASRPTCSLGWLASSCSQPFGEPAFRMNLFAALCVAVAAGVDGRPGPDADPIDAARRRWPASGLALTPAAWAIGTHAEAHALHLALAGGPAAPARRLGGRSAAADAARRAGPIAGCSRRRRVRAVGRQPLADAAAGAAGRRCTCSPSIRGILRRPAARRRVLGRARRRRSCWSTSSCRCGPGRSGRRSSTDGRTTWDGFWYIVLAEQFRGSVVDPFGDLAGKVGELVDAGGRPVRAAGGADPARRSSRRRSARPRYALLTGSGARSSRWFFAASYVNADIGRYYLVPGADRLDLARDPRRAHRRRRWPASPPATRDLRTRHRRRASASPRSSRSAFAGAARWSRP